MANKFHAGQEVKILPSPDHWINPVFVGQTGPIMPNEPSGMHDYYVKVQDDFGDVALAVYENEIALTGEDGQ